MESMGGSVRSACRRAAVVSLVSGLVLTEGALHAGEKGVVASTLRETPRGHRLDTERRQAPDYAPGRLLVKYRPGRGEGHGRAFEGDPDLELVAAPDGVPVPEAARRQEEDPDVLYAEPDYLVQVSDIVPTDPRWAEQWDMVKIAAPAAWATQTDASDVVVGVVDTGIDVTHPDLAANLWTNPADGTHGFTARNGVITAGGQDDHGHGTHVAGTIGAAANNGAGIAGINWSVRLLALKFLDASGSGSSSDAILLLDRAIALKQQGVNLRVLNNSWGGGGYSQALKDAFDRAEAAGILSACAAGNSGQNADVAPMYPGAFDGRGIVSVLATDASDVGASFSNHGVGTTDLSAPGVNTLSTVPPGPCSLCDGTRYRLLSGTSMATPHVAGVLAAIFHTNPALTPAQARDVVLDRLSTDLLTDPRAAQSSTSARLNFAKTLANPKLASPSLNGFPSISAPGSLSASPGSTVTLSASASDPDGDTLKTAWAKPRYQDTTWLMGKVLDSVFPAPSGNPSTFTAPSLAMPASLRYTVATADGRGGSAVAKTSVTVAAAAAPGGAPAGTLTVTPSSGPAGTVVTVSFPAADPQGGTVYWDLVTNGKLSSSGSCCYVGPSISLPMPTAGVYRLRTQAIDRELNLSPSSSVVVSIGGATGVPPIANATLDRKTGTVPLAVSYDLRGSYDPDGTIAKYQVDCQGDGVLQETTSPTGTCTFNEPGPRFLRFFAVDSAGFWDSAYHYVMALPSGSAPPPPPPPPPAPDTTAPTATLTGPANGSTVARRSTVTLTASASDNVGVTRVELSVNGAVACSDASTPYSCAWAVPGKPNSSYQLRAVAYDAAGNAGASPISVVTAR